MNGKLFGTDGIRGIANKDLTPALAMKVGRACAEILGKENKDKPKILLATDTRISKDMLAGALSAGLSCAGADVINIGVMPTPAVAYLVTRTGSDAGIMISASHNPCEYNGIKIFGREGYKLSDELEEKIETMISEDAFGETPLGEGVGRIFDMDYSRLYIDHLVRSSKIEKNSLRIAVDCANGSASRTAKRLFEALDINADIFADSPDGTNINKNCGSTVLSNLTKIVKDGGYDLGIAFDGDADRLLAVDENGEEVDGDRIIAVSAEKMLREGKLKGNTVVGTVMSNLGLRKFCEAHGLSFFPAKVGDRYVLEKMTECGYNLGGEQSGHIIFSDYATTGDGQLAAIKLIEAVVDSGKKLSELASCMTKYPQITLNLRASAKEKAMLTESPAIIAAHEEARRKIGEDGRILLRASGTEPLIRIMAEGKDTELINSVLSELADVILREKV